ncbi:hypothetical protein BV22DRAFT_464247 [Leucogyrophana mollusca]|uniref:Uncharacterized protein n=1 Tax=Leucogyrophana mollusca TaxID=85980 RepID=A0ACB8BHR8_9AGAM|nr:hypothetical protein BV22DRAFT_464247 [Leucogyrophana mollusca]
MTTLDDRTDNAVAETTSISDSKGMRLHASCPDQWPAHPAPCGFRVTETTYPPPPSVSFISSQCCCAELGCCSPPQNGYSLPLVGLGHEDFAENDSSCLPFRQTTKGVLPRACR